MMEETTPLLSRILAPGANRLWKAGAFFATAGIVLGAFGNHAIRGWATPEKVQAWQTGAHYAMFNGIGLLVLSMHPRFSVHRFAGPAIAIGSLLFSGSIVALVLDRQRRFRFLGPVTPIGGSLMIAGYISLLF